MESGFSEAWAQSVVMELRDRGVEFVDGFSESEIARIGEAFGVAVPLELEMFLSAGVPVSPRWARWVEGPDVVAASAKAWIDRAFAFDIEQNGYWHLSFGERPQALSDAIEKATEFVASAPPLLPIYGHRFLTTEPSDGSRAVCRFGRLPTRSSMGTIWPTTSLVSSARADPRGQPRQNQGCRFGRTYSLYSVTDDALSKK